MKNTNIPTRIVCSNAPFFEAKCAISDEGVVKRAAMAALEQAIVDCGKHGVTAAELRNVVAAARVPSLEDRTDSDRFEVPSLKYSRIGLDPLPNLLAVRGGGIPTPLRKISSWVTWKMRRMQWRETSMRGYDPKRCEKIFFNPNGSQVGAMSQRVGGRFEDAIAGFERSLMHYPGGVFGVGFALKLKYGIVAIDLDDVVNPRTGEILPVARAIVEQINSYTEVSPTMRGLRIFAYATLPVSSGPRTIPRARVQPHGSKFGIYNDGHVATVTGFRLLRHTKIIKERQSEILSFYERYIYSTSTI